MSAAVGVGCQSTSQPPASDTGSSSGAGSSSGGSVPYDAGSSSGGKDASAKDSGGGADASADAPTHDATYDAPAFSDSPIGPTVDAPYDVVAPTDAPIHGNGNLCAQALGWSMSGAALDSTVVSASAADALNPLLSAQNPLTLAESFEDAGSAPSPPWIIISGTETNTISQQYFPYTYPTTPAALVQTGGSGNPVFTATSPAGAPSTGWIRLLDSTQAEVWIALTNISATLNAGDNQCQTLASSEVDAVIPSSAGSTTMVLSSGTTSVAALFGAATSTSPAGWNMRMTFTGQRVQVTFK